MMCPQETERLPMATGGFTPLVDGIDYIWNCLNPVLQGFEDKFQLSAQDRARIIVEPPKNRAHGDLSTNAALVLAKLARTSPQNLGVTLAQELGKSPMIAQASVAGPGFVNVSFIPDFFHDLAQKAI